MPPSQKLVSEKWLRDYCETHDAPPYDSFVKTAVDYVDSGSDEEYLHFDGQDAHGDIPPELWTHLENVTGRRLDGEKPKYFSCAC